MVKDLVSNIGWLINRLGDDEVSIPELMIPYTFSALDLKVVQMSPQRLVNKCS